MDREAMRGIPGAADRGPISAKGAVAAIMKNDEDAHQKGPRQHRQWQCDPPVPREAQVHQIPDQGIRPEGVDQLPDGRPEGRLFKLDHELTPFLHSGGTTVFSRF